MRYKTRIISNKQPKDYTQLVIGQSRMGAASGQNKVNMISPPPNKKQQQQQKP